MYIYLAESTSLKIGRAATVTSCNVHNLNRILWFDDIWSAKPMIPYDTASLFNQGKLDITADGVVEAVSGMLCDLKGSCRTGPSEVGQVDPVSAHPTFLSFFAIIASRPE